MEIPEELQFSYSEVEHTIEKGIKNYIGEKKINKAFIGISGGLDSAVTTYLTTKAIGNDKVVGIKMNDTVTQIQDKVDAEKIIEELKIKSLDINISPIVNRFEDLLKQELFSKFTSEDLKKVSEMKSKIAYANIKPRLRMTILYFFANRLNGAVIGTSDKSEILMGYFTKYGDGAADIFPLGDLYKTQVRALGEYLGLPESILRKKSSPGLILHQTAEEELGFDYTTADLVLFYKLEKNYSKRRIIETLKLEEGIVNKILDRVKMSYHKRKMPPIIFVKK